VSTGSFLGLAHQGRGIGREMRAAVLHLAFDGLGARRAETAAFSDNPASRRVTEVLGYRSNGDEVVVRRGEAAVVERFVLDRAAWEAGRRDDVVVEGLSPEALDMFGLP
jgi:RimJ/RimL family protein N-acetyltransferase